MTTENLLRVLSAIAAVVLGSGGIVVLFFVANWLVDRLPRNVRPRLLPLVYLAPAVLLLFIYLVVPSLRTFYLSFFDARSRNFVGLANYIFAFTDRGMLIAFRNNILWLVLVTGISVGLGLIIAVLVDRVKYEPLAKALIFLPMAISFVGASVIWRFIYAYNPPDVAQIGLLNAIVVSLGFEPVGWLVNRTVNNLALITIMIWLQTGFAMVLLSAAVKGIPKDVIEAARIDGANELQIFRRITVPMISSTIVVVATTIIVAVLKVFDIVFVMTGGLLDTDVIASRMIREMFNFRHFGRGSAIAVILLLAVVPVMLTNIKRFRQQEATR
ncbi:sugar ABC transporter permease [Pseudanabaena sp. FACHB-2040]|uniref:carbohydrate ABC transporter permease n=1 Tax=Pseudanabaena sp. FACHB-2040 TaxID=2692859 RepID=UPI001684F48F|nr:sugar ABC transporter permease [Pseudanabaena sp. FACHB-2040]MBD2255946.1 sugar ABC transporter permease [Pseudanabaena sp. FACHB-2040]